MPIIKNKLGKNKFEKTIITKIQKRKEKEKERKQNNVN
jgi:hypothetical protein